MRLAFTLIFLLTSIDVVAQTNGGTGNTLPSTCVQDSTFVKSGSNAGLYYCSTTNTWTQVGSAGGNPEWSSIQNKPAAVDALSGTNTGNQILSYTLHVQALTSAPVDGQTVYFGQTPAAPTTTQGTRRIYIRKAGTIRQVNIFSFSGTVGTNEAWTCNVRLNNTGDTAIATVSAAAAERTWFNSNLNLAVTTSDYIEIKCVSPTWATNPNTWIPGGYLIIEYQ